jgi:hypothetical protein
MDQVPKRISIVFCICSGVVPSVKFFFVVEDIPDSGIQKYIHTWAMCLQCMHVEQGDSALNNLPEQML